jgi:hypothetical protein
MVGTRHKIYNKGRLYDINMSFYLGKNPALGIPKTKAYENNFFCCFFFSLGERFSLKTD